MAASVIKTQSGSNTETPRRSASRLMRWLSSGLWIVAAALLLISINFPYWGLVLHAPQYPGGLEVRLFVNYLTGDEDPRRDEVREIDGLNHYIGMKSLFDAAKIEQAIALPALIGMVVVLAGVAILRRRWMWLLTLPAILFPIVYLVDLGLWMVYYGNNLDPYAPLSTSISPFTPPVLGEGVIGQFRTVAFVNTGWYLAAVAAVLTLIAVVLFILQNRREAKKG